MAELVGIAITVISFPLVIVIAIAGFIRGYRDPASIFGPRRCCDDDPSAWL
jgi:hypothetical protein